METTTKPRLERVTPDRQRSCSVCERTLYRQRPCWRAVIDALVLYVCGECGANYTSEPLDETRSLRSMIERREQRQAQRYAITSGAVLA